MKNYYVYVYIDPRNNEEFYFGKGKGSRKDAHLNAESDSEKAKRIRAIKREGLEPIIRVIAQGLSENDALLVEKTLLWKLGKQLTNVSTGQFAENFRPHDCLHKKIPGFDFQNGLYFYNVGERGGHRNWDDYRRYRFISGGQGKPFRDAMRAFEIGDVIAAYISRHGFVGVGKITDEAKPIRDVTINGKPLLSLPLVCKNMGDNAEDDKNSEYVALVKWVKTVERDDARFKSKYCFTPRLVRASLDNQPKTVRYVEEQFAVNLRDLIE